MLVLTSTIHKTLFLPVRIGLTAAFMPCLVAWLSRKGWAVTSRGHNLQVCSKGRWRRLLNSMDTNSHNHWLQLNAKHTTQQMEVSHTSMLLNDAQDLLSTGLDIHSTCVRMHGFRGRLKIYCRALIQRSPFLNAAGSHVDMEGVALRGEKEFN